MATKKITELPLIQTISGSFSVVPIVIGDTAGNGTTDQITIENFSKFVTQYSAHTGSAGNTFAGPQIINNNVTITGRLTVTEVVAQYETASILFSTGSTKLGDEITDKHEFTGSTNITGSLIVNGANLTDFSASNSTTFTNFSSSNSSRITELSSSNSSYNTTFSSSNSTTFTNFSSSNSTYNTTFSSSNATYVTALSSSNSTTFTNYSSSNSTTFTNYSSSTANTINGLSSGVSSELARVYQSTASIQAQTASLLEFTASQVDRNTTLSIVTGSLNQFTASQDDRNFTLSQVTGSLIGITNGLMAFTAALDNTYATDAQLYQLYQATRSLELHSGSMIGVTNGLMAYTASNTTLNTGLRGEVDGIEAYTASLKGQAIVSSSTQVQNYDVFALNSNLYTSTGSLIGITNGLMAFTAALDSTYATDAQLYQLYQATRSIELTTGSLIGITNGLMAFTASLDNTFATDAQLYQLYQSTRSIELTTGSLIGITNGLMAFTAALDSTYATDAQLYQLYAETASIKAEIGGIEAYTASLKAAAIVSSSTQVQNYDIFALNSNLYNGTGSIKGEIAGIEAYTASLKGAAIVSSSQQITNYYKFAETASANIFYGNQSVSGSLAVNSTGASGISIISSGDSPTLNFTQLAQANGGARNWRLISNYEGWGTMDIQVSADNATLPSSTTRVSLTAAGDLNIKAGNLVMGTSGKGIDFSATSNGSGTTSSELLNDYEEGTFTPTYTGVNLTVVSYGNQFGWYTKVGRLVTVTICLMTEDITVVGSENLKIGGLPFTSNSTAQASNALIIADSSRWASNPPIAGVITPNTTEVILYKDLGAVGAGTDPTTVKTSDLADATGNRNVVRGTLTYFV